MNIFIVIIWHQAGGRNNNKTYYTWQDENENTKTFDSEISAKKAWKESGLKDIHVAFVVNCATAVNDWI